MPNEGELILTWARMHAPSGYGLSTFGVFPSICTAEDPPDVDGLLQGLRDGRLQPGEAVTPRRASSSLNTAGPNPLLPCRTAEPHPTPPNAPHPNPPPPPDPRD